MKAKHSLLLILVLQQALALTTRPQHLLAANPSHQWFYAGQIFQTFQLIGLLVVIIGVGVCCFYCRGFFSSHDRAPTVVHARSRQENIVAALPPRSFEPEQYEPAPVRAQPKNNAILDYFSSQKPAPSNPLPAEVIKQSSSPYVTKKNAPNTNLGWEPYSSNITSCGVCNLFNKGNQIPMMQVECLEDHCFHIRCLSQHRSKAVLDFAGNGLNKCPKCKEIYSPVVKIFCPGCKRMAITINLLDYSAADTGQIETQRIMGKFGICCQNCVPQ